MPQVPGTTVSFKLEKDNEEKIRSILETVYQALEEKGYNPINQLVGFMISGEPAYITSHNEARQVICKVDRDEIMEVLLKSYLQK
ncbi:MAG: IreB family regulatory phosphoprotein [Syntrophomonadaceae bacterium]|nr:IreB family regulatory phosphoprotein [Syntrophomonadaceae bacterium]MDD3023342.1 IreB family regulatory phosphoprotein [Syntrophomonadaceae bacterium]